MNLFQQMSKSFYKLVRVELSLHYTLVIFTSLYILQLKNKNKKQALVRIYNQRSSRWAQKQMQTRADITGWLLKIIKGFLLKQWEGIEYWVMYSLLGSI